MSSRLISEFKRKLAAFPLLRQYFIPFFERINIGDITVRHAVTKDPIRLHSFRHRGYWFYGKTREQKTLEIWKDCVLPGQKVIEVGGHIGYLTVLLSRLVGRAQLGGGVVVFEPGINNLPYLQKNTTKLDNVVVEPLAVGDRNGQAKFYLENLTGQNNSLSEDYGGFASSRKSANYSGEYEEIIVEMVTLDVYCRNYATFPDWLKIDVEGHEFEVIRGGIETITRNRPAITIEITKNNQAVGELLRDLGYSLHSADSGVLVGSVPNSGNYFALHKDKHGDVRAYLQLISV